MTGSQTLGVRIPERVLAGVDRFAQVHELTRSNAIAVLVEQALSGSEIAPGAVPTPAKEDASGGQDTASGQRAQQWGIRTARKIAAVLQAEKAADQPMANEFMLDGKRVAIKCAKPTTTQCGLTNTMRRSRGLHHLCITDCGRCLQSVQGDSGTVGEIRKRATKAQPELRRPDPPVPFCLSAHRRGSWRRRD